MAESAATLAAAGIESARFEARLLLAEAAWLERSTLLREPERLIDPAPFRAMVARRAAREPLAYILGWQEFWSLRFAVSPATLIPRADSETLVEAAVAARPGGVGRVLDLGTGTGCLLLATLSEMPGAWGVGVDRSPAAADLARSNAVSIGVSARCAMMAGDWGAALDGRFDLVLSNPPYIETDVIAGLMPEVAGHEPARALDGGRDGLVAYRAIIGQLPGLLQPDGLAILELGIGQATAAAALARSAGLARVGVRCDLSGVERALILAVA